MSEVGTAQRKLRVKERKTYTDEGVDDDEIEGKRNFDLEEKLSSKAYDKKFVKIIKGEEFNLSFLQENGLETPLLMYDKTGTGLRVPSQNFHVSDVKQCVGSRRVLDVMDVTTQKGKEMSMREWVQYYENKNRDRLLNVISLEFSHTRLENYVESPNVVRQIDWVDTVWPRHLKECQTESTNIIEKMKYPKVQKYCLMSVGGCYTDFHIDFGGTSVWYHILHGEKVFWLIPPTEKNFDIYVNWVLSGKQGDVFLADHVDGCQRIELREGYTFIIPSGWIHAVYTPKDSLVFGGNFLHNYNIVNQLRVSDIEDRTHVKQKFRYPFYAEIAWYVLAQYLCCVKGKQCIEKPPEEGFEKRSRLHVIETVSNDEDSRPPSRCSQDANSEKSVDCKDAAKFCKKLSVELTRIEDLHGRSDDGRRQTIRTFSSDSCSSADTEIYERSEDAESLHEPDEKLVRNMEKFQSNTKKSSVSPSDKKVESKVMYLSKWEIDGLMALVEWLEALPPTKKGIPKDLLDADAVLRDIKELISEHKNDDPVLAITGEPILKWPPTKPRKIKKMRMPGGKKQPKSNQSSSSIRRRRVRCKKCEPCTRTECMECTFCKDMKKFGGPGRMKQSCISRQCLAPELPCAAVCMICNKDEKESKEQETTLMECGICWEIVHPVCLRNTFENLDDEGVINEDLPNSWECPKCCHDGKQGQLKPRVPKFSSMKAKYHEMMIGSPSSVGSPVMEIAIKEEEEEMDGKFEGKRVTSRVSNSFRKENILENVESSENKSMWGENELEEVQGCISEEHKKPIGKNDSIIDDDEGRQSISSKSTPRRLSPKRKKFASLKSNSDDGILKKIPVQLHKQKPQLQVPQKTRVTEKMMLKCKSSPSKMRLKPNISPVVKLTPLKPKRKISISPKKNSSRMTPEGDASVVTRSGRTVKKSTQLSDENLTSEIPRKRPRREIVVRGPSLLKKRRLSASKRFLDTRKGRPKTLVRKTRTPALHLNVQTVSSSQHQVVACTTEVNFLFQTQEPLIANSLETKAQNLGPFVACGQKGTTKRHSSLPSQGSHTPSKKKSSPGKAASLSFPSGSNQGPSSSGKKQDPSDCSKSGQATVPQQHVVRPCLSAPMPNYVLLENGRQHILTRELWLKVLRYLSSQDLVCCMQVCQTWYHWCLNPSLWSIINLSGKRICQPHLIGIVKRQPLRLVLNSVTMTQKQLIWLLARIPGLRYLSLSSCSWATVSALCLGCPLLTSLNLSWAIGIGEQEFKDIVLPPVDRIPGMMDISRLHLLKSLLLAGTEINDSCLSLLADHLKCLEKLDISYCAFVTNDGLEMLLSSDKYVSQTLTELDISGCRHVTEAVLQTLNLCDKLVNVYVRNCRGIANDALQKVSAGSKITFAQFGSSGF